MKEYLKSFGYTVAGLVVVVGVCTVVCITMDALHRISPYVEGGVIAVLMLLLLTSLVHLMRTGN